MWSSILLLKDGRRLWLFFGTRTTLLDPTALLEQAQRQTFCPTKSQGCRVQAVPPPAWLLLLGGFPQSRAEPQLQLRWVAALTRLLQV